MRKNSPNGQHVLLRGSTSRNCAYHLRKKNKKQKTKNKKHKRKIELGRIRGKPEKLETLKTSFAVFQAKIGSDHRD
jgi:ribosomal protein L7Ae-like RNA K-turn-binding protein